LSVLLTFFSVSLPVSASDSNTDPQLDENRRHRDVCVSAPAIDVPASVTVLDRQTLRDAGRTNFEDVLGLIPNLIGREIPRCRAIFNCAVSANWNSIKGLPIRRSAF